MPTLTLMSSRKTETTLHRGFSIVDAVDTVKLQVKLRTRNLSINV